MGIRNKVLESLKRLIKLKRLKKLKRIGKLKEIQEVEQIGRNLEDSTRYKEQASIIIRKKLRSSWECKPRSVLKRGEDRNSK